MAQLSSCSELKASLKVGIVLSIVRKTYIMKEN